MYRKKFEKVILIFIAFVILIFFSICVFANEKQSNVWNVRITNDTKELILECTEDIKFEVEKNPNVVSRKFAPGMTAIASIDIDLTEIESAIDIKLESEELQNSQFELISYINNEEYILGDIKTINPSDDNQTIILKLIWKEDNIKDTEIGVVGEKIEIPVKITIEENI